jgi:uncharacterized protein YecE (DUF72 family)
MSNANDKFYQRLAKRESLQCSGLKEAASPSFPRAHLTDLVARLAKNDIYVGTSSWKYEGWLDLIYTPARYMTRGKLSRTKFEKNCLTEFAEVFKTVCLDAGFYQFPSVRMLDGIFSQVPGDFRLSIKVTEDITVKKFPNLPRYGRRAGQSNDHFLDADLFVSSFLTPLGFHQEQIGTLIFEFSPFYAGDWERGRDFVEALDRFFRRLPTGWKYSVEIRNESFLRPEYFEVLHRHGVSHTFNSWSRMPPITEQMNLPNSFTADFATARLLLKPGRNYEQAVEKFQPYSEVREPNAEARLALINLLTAPAPLDRSGCRFLYVNNRLEGCALWTIYAAITGLAART